MIPAATLPPPQRDRDTHRDEQKRNGHWQEAGPHVGACQTDSCASKANLFGAVVCEAVLGYLATIAPRTATCPTAKCPTSGAGPTLCCLARNARCSPSWPRGAGASPSNCRARHHLQHQPQQVPQQLQFRTLEDVRLDFSELVVGGGQLDSRGSIKEFRVVGSRPRATSARNCCLDEGHGRAASALPPNLRGHDHPSSAQNPLDVSIGLWSGLPVRCYIDR